MSNNFRILYNKCCFLILCFFSLNAAAQKNIPLGTWRTHNSYQQAQSIVGADTKIYCASPNSLFYFDKEDQSFNTLTQLDGLSGNQFSSINWNASSHELWIGYKDGRIDILSESNLTPVDLIYKSPVSSDKYIKHITFYQSRAFVTTDFGMVVIDRKTLEARETYSNLGEGGEELLLHHSASLRDTLFLATEEGIITAPLNQPGLNLMDYNNWNRFDTIGNQVPAKAALLATDGERLLAADGAKVYQYSGQWNLLHTFEASVTHLSESNGKFWLIADDKLYEWGDAGFVLKILPETSKPVSVYEDQAGHLWIADQHQGILTNFDGSFKNLYPEGPISNEIRRVYSPNAGSLIVLHKEGVKPEGFSVFENGRWKTLTAVDFPALNEVNLVDVVYEPFNQKTYLATENKGILEWDGAEQFRFISLPEQLNFPSYKLTADPMGNLWILTGGSGLNLHRYAPDQVWTSFRLPDTFSESPSAMLTDGKGNVWVTVTTVNLEGIVGFNPEMNRSVRLKKEVDPSNDFPSKEVLSLALDYQGQLWIGTANGAIIAFYPSEVFSSNEFNLLRPIFEGYTLLRDKEVTSLKVDGANRKWAGTPQGVWLLDENGESSRYYFDASNSPIPSTEELAIEITHGNGEVFFATAQGMVSFRSDAVPGQAYHQEVKIFPNPVPPDFNGTVGISGLANFAEVKITDATGNLMRELTANGSVASWDLKDLYGQQVETGVYFVFSTSEDGEDFFVGKLAVVR